MISTRLLNLVPLAILTLSLASLSHAQAAGPTGGQLKPAPQRRQGRPPVIEALAKVNLTPEEKTKIKALVKTRNENLKTFRDAHQGDGAVLKTYAEAQQKLLMDGIKGVLNPTQWDQFQIELKKIMEEARAARKSGAGAGQSAGAGSTPPQPPAKGS